MVDYAKTWQGKANRIIATLSMQAYKRANPKTSYARKHTPYCIPDLANDLVKCLNNNDEIGAKTLFLSYDGLKAIENDHV